MFVPRLFRYIPPAVNNRFMQIVQLQHDAPVLYVLYKKVSYITRRDAYLYDSLTMEQDANP